MNAPDDALAQVLRDLEAERLRPIPPVTYRSPEKLAEERNAGRQRLKRLHREVLEWESAHPDWATEQRAATI